MKLIINADDFGLSKSITDGIITGITEGYITSTTIMANMPYTEYAIKQAMDYNIKCIGLHVNLTVGKPILKNGNIVDEQGVFYYNKNQIENKSLTYNDAFNEIMAQIDIVNKYSEGKIKIDHIDTHHHLFDNENIKQAVIDIAKKLNIPIRNEGNVDIKKPDILYHDFTIKNVNVNNLREMIKKFDNQNIIVEIMTHPGFIDEYTKSVTSYLDREKELNILKEAKALGLFDNIELINFSQF